MRGIHSKPDPNLVVYCDESGNSGPNLLDLNQPIYVLGGWVVPASLTSAAEDVVRETCETLCPSSDELHGTKLLRTKKGQSGLAAFIGHMGRAGAWPVYEVAEKRYWIAGKIVETFLDPAYNDSSSWAFYNDIDQKQELANDLTTFPDEYLQEFALAYRSLDPGGLERSANRLAAFYDLKGQRRLAHAVRGCCKNLPDITRHERQANSSFPSNALATVNLPTLASFLSLVEDMARDLLVESVRMVHDESREFAAAYQWVSLCTRTRSRVSTSTCPTAACLRTGLRRFKRWKWLGPRTLHSFKPPICWWQLFIATAAVQRRDKLLRNGC